MPNTCIKTWNVRLSHQHNIMAKNNIWTAAEEEIDFMPIIPINESDAESTDDEEPAEVRLPGNEGSPGS